MANNTPILQKSIFLLPLISSLFLNQPLTHLSGHNPRLYKKSSGQWDLSPVHEQVATNDHQIIKLGDKLSGRIVPPLFHYSHRTIGSYLIKMHTYTTLEAKHMLLTKRHRSGRVYLPTFLLPYRLFVRQLVKLLFYRRGFLDGITGDLWCILSAYYEFAMAKKYYHLSRSARSAPVKSAPDQPLK